MNFNQEFVSQLEEIDKYYESNKDNKLTSLVIKKIRLEFIKTYIESMDRICMHTNLIDKGYFNYQENDLVKANKENAKYHKKYCPICKIEIIYLNKHKQLIKSK